MNHILNIKFDHRFNDLCPLSDRDDEKNDTYLYHQKKNVVGVVVVLMVLCKLNIHKYESI